jgi:hypothetical protein
MEEAGWAGQLVRRAPERQLQTVRHCAWADCKEGEDGGPREVPSARTYCGRAHAGAARRGRGRHGGDIRCGCRAQAHRDRHGRPCGAPLGHVRRSRIKRAKRHYCLDCRLDRPWLQAAPPPRFCQRCGRTLSRGAMTRCLACRQLERERGSYRHERDGKVLDLLAAGWSHRQIARELPIARATVDRIRARLGVPPRPAPPIEPTHPGLGTMEGFQSVGSAAPSSVTTVTCSASAGVSRILRYVPEPSSTKSCQPWGVSAAISTVRRTASPGRRSRWPVSNVFVKRPPSRRLAEHHLESLRQRGTRPSGRAPPRPAEPLPARPAWIGALRRSPCWRLG